MRLLVLTLALLALVSGIWAQAQQSVELDLRTAIDIALKNNPSLRSVEQGEAIARARVEQARAVGNFRVGVNSSYIHLSDPTLFRGVPVIEADTNVNVLQVSKPVYTGGATQAARTQARWGVLAASEQIQAAREELALAVTENYMRTLQAREGIAVAESAIACLEANLSAAEKLRGEGVAARADVYRAETDLAAARESRILAEEGYQVQLAVLRSLLNLEPGTQLSLPEAAGPPPELETAANDAGPVTDRPEVRALQDVVKASESGVRRAKAGNRPVMDVVADYVKIGTGANFPRVDNSVSLGVRLSVPLWDGGSTRANVHEAEAALRRVQSDLDSLIQRVRLEEDQARLALKSAEARVATSEVRVRFARESLRVSEVSYQEGIAPITDVLAASTALTVAENSQVNSLYDRYVAQARLLKARGHLTRILNSGE